MASLSSSDQRIAALNATIDEVEGKIRHAEAKLDALDAKAEAFDAKFEAMKQAGNDDSRIAKDVAFLCVEQQQLRAEELKLRAEKQHLRAEELKLRAEELKLRDEELQVRALELIQLQQALQSTGAKKGMGVKSFNLFSSCLCCSTLCCLPSICICRNVSLALCFKFFSRCISIFSPSHGFSQSHARFVFSTPTLYHSIVWLFVRAAADVMLVLHGQFSASECTSSATRVTVQGVGLLFSRLFPGPPLRDRVLALFAECTAPADDVVTRLADVLVRVHLDTPDLRVVHMHEHVGSSASGSRSKLTVQSHHFDELARRLRFETTTTTCSTLKRLGCESGVVTGQDYRPKGYARKPFRRLKLGHGGGLFDLVSLIAEVTNSTDAPVESLRQAAAEAADVALAQARAGVPIDRIRVPVWSSNGQLMKFGVVRMLEPAFPYLEVLTKTLDIGDRSDRHDAAWLLQLLSDWCQQEVAFNGVPRAELALSLSLGQYFLKPLSAVTSMYACAELGLQHMMDVLARFHGTPAQACVVLPITSVTRVDGVSDGQLVFPHLSRQGFRLGMPTDPSQRDALVEAILQAMHRIHAAGVVHVDLYFSNIMWRRDADGQMLVMIVDWDTVHENGEPLMVAIRDCLSRDRLTLLGADVPPKLASPALDLVFLDVLSKHRHAAVLQVDNKQLLDAAFRSLVADEANEKRAAHAYALFARSANTSGVVQTPAPHGHGDHMHALTLTLPDVDVAVADVDVAIDGRGVRMHVVALQLQVALQDLQ
jgi:hypothetical protein